MAHGVAPVSAPSIPTQPDFVGFGPEQARVVRDALGLFAEAGLRLPPIVFRASLDKAACHGRDGWYSANAQRVRITLCSSQRDARERHVVLHELAHAWAAFDLSTTRRSEFQAVRGWTYWLDYDHATWRNNGGEQAAEIIAWGLNDHSAPALSIDHKSCAELAAGYVALTGSPPLHGLTKVCSAQTTRVLS